MKTTRIFKLMGILLLGIFLTAQIYAVDFIKRSDEKKAITLTIDKPMFVLLTKAFAEKIDAQGIVGMQKILGQIEHVTISFGGEEAADFLLKFEPVDEQQLEAWMFDEGYLSSDYETEMEVSVPWMENMRLG